ncbi:S8 family serine peptidase [Verrucosispora sp. WMMA2044]|uniref:S8 family serine peptidase n=1 Tax=Verrucosispora sp. WMMA2044 TaxID=3016419 RepID=UPI00248CD84C|nr:S8 family serine peptidase [Verrucosispora sp. WMMA2044]WBB48314.1 S8 family serine peptidase [Verrucosispora sp. WMMA2044]
MKRRGVLRRSAAAGLALATASSIIGVVSGGAATAAPADNQPRRELIGKTGAGIVPGRYIVVLKDREATHSSVRATASALSRANGGSVRLVFGNALKGYSAALNQQQAERLAADPAVAYVEPVRRLSANSTQSNPPSWGLDRLDQASAKLTKTYKYPNTGSKVTAYILDTGINVKHQDFGGRASMGYDAIDPEADPAGANGDCNGHGTHVAGTVGGATYGVAKGVKLVGVRVLDCDGYGTTEQVLAGINWVTTNASKPAVANVSLGDVTAIPSIDEAVKRSIDSGVTYAIAAGNAWMDACKASPARVPDAITVGATDRVDMRAWFSNYGKCVDVFAPGVSIVSARHDSNTGGVGFSGTSMAAPHVAGAAALLLHTNPTWTPKQVRDRIVTTGIAGVVYDTKGSMDRLLTVGSVTPVRNGYGLKAVANGRYVTAASTTKALVNNGTSMGTAQRFDIVNAGDGLVALRSKQTGRYVVAPSKGTLPLIASHKTIVTPAKFTVVNHTDGKVSLKAKTNGKYVTASTTGTAVLRANRTSIGTNEKFTLEAPAPVISIRSKANNKYVVAASSTKPLVASSTSVTTSAKFQIVKQGDGFFGLKALSNGRYVTAASSGTKPLIASSTTLGLWQTFDFVDYNGDGTVFFRASDGQAVSAGTSGTSNLISNKTIRWTAFELGLGKGEKFTVSAA